MGQERNEYKKMFRQTMQALILACHKIVELTEMTGEESNQEQDDDLNAWITYFLNEGVRALKTQEEHER